MRIALIGHAQGVHPMLAAELKRQGHSVLLLRGGRLDAWRAASVEGYDVVTLQHPCFMPLPEWMLQRALQRLVNRNARVCLTACMPDIVYLDEALNPESTLTHSPYRIGARRTERAHSQRLQLIRAASPGVRRYTEWFYDNIHGAVATRYEYGAACATRLGTRAALGGIPVDTHATATPWTDGPVRVFGTDEEGQNAVRTIQARYPQMCRLETESVLDSHLVVDEYGMHSPSAVALRAMAAAIPVLGGANPEYYRLLGCADTEHPVIQAATDPIELAVQIAGLTANAATLHARGAECRAWVLRHHNPTAVAHRYLRHWTACLNS